MRDGVTVGISQDYPDYPYGKGVLEKVVTQYSGVKERAPQDKSLKV